MPEWSVIHGALRGGKAPPEYFVWRNMRQRCGNPKDKAYANYGGRGIVVCTAWQQAYSAFIADMGARPSPKHTIERRDNDGPYAPENCCWATWAEQHRNKRKRTNFDIAEPYWMLRHSHELGEHYRLVFPKSVPVAWYREEA